MTENDVHLPTLAFAILLVAGGVVGKLLGNLNIINALGLLFIGCLFFSFRQHRTLATLKLPKCISVLLALMMMLQWCYTKHFFPAGLIVLLTVAHLAAVASIGKVYPRHRNIPQRLGELLSKLRLEISSAGSANAKWGPHAFDGTSLLSGRCTTILMA